MCMSDFPWLCLTPEFNEFPPPLSPWWQAPVLARWDMQSRLEETSAMEGAIPCESNMAGKPWGNYGETMGNNQGDMYLICI